MESTIRLKAFGLVLFLRKEPGKRELGSRVLGFRVGVWGLGARKKQSQSPGNSTTFT